MRLASTATIADMATRSARGWSRPEALLIVAVLLIFIVLVWIGASGVRGSDQYWYVADVESLVEGRGVQSNEVYPAAIRDGVTSLPRPFVHNILNVYVAALPAVLFGAYGGWIALNVVSSLLTAILIFGTVVRLTDSRPAALIAGLSYLLLPLTVWQTTQPLAEASIAPLVALSAYIYATADASYWRWVLLMVLVSLLDYCRASFMPLLPFVPIAYLVHAPSRRIETVARATGIAALGIALWLLGESLFEPNVRLPYLQLMGSDGPEFRNMALFFDLSPATQQPISAVISNAIKGLSLQFTKVDASYLLFYLPFNILALAPLALLLRRQRADVTRAAVAGLIALGLHLATAMLIRNQARYLLVAVPPLLVATGIVLAQAAWLRSARTSVTLITAGMLILVAPSAALAWRSHNEGIEDRLARASLAPVFDRSLPIDDTVMVAMPFDLKGFDGQRWGYLLRPRRVLYVADRYDANDYAVLIRNVGPKWLLSRRDSPVIDRLAPSLLRYQASLPAPYADWSLYKIENGDGAP